MATAALCAKARVVAVGDLRRELGPARFAAPCVRPYTQAVKHAQADALNTPGLVRIGGAALLVSVLLPFSPTGLPFWRLALEAFIAHPVQGAIVAFGYGAPFWFGLCLLLAPADLRAQGSWSRASQWVLGLFHAQLLLTAWLLARAGMGVAPWPLFGFALVSGLHFATRGARFSASSAAMVGAPPPTWWLARWGAIMVVALCGWLRLQSLVDLRLGFAVEVAWVGALLVAWKLTRVRVSAVAPEQADAVEN